MRESLLNSVVYKAADSNGFFHIGGLL